MKDISTAPKDRVILLTDGRVWADGYFEPAAYNGNGAWIWPYVHKTPTHYSEFPTLEEDDTRDDELVELRRQKDALCEELENIATADWAGFDDDRRRAPYEFAMWAQSRARHTLNRVLSGDVTKPLPEDAQLYRSCEESRAKWEAKNPLEKVGVGRTVPEPNCDRSVCGDWSPGGCDHPDCPALGNKLPKQEGMTIKEDPQFREELRKMMAEQRGKSVPVPHA